jgi:hypothetical protein
VGQQTQFWRLFKAVWADKDLDSISRKSVARKNNLVPILLQALQTVLETEGNERRDLLDGINDAVEPLLKRTSEYKIRPLYEPGTAIFGTALTLAQSLPQDDGLRESFAMSFATIFRSVLFEDRASKKLARAFFKNALAPALMYLADSKTGHPTTIAVEGCVQEAIFSSDNLVDFINAVGKVEESGFLGLMASLPSSDVISEAFDGISSSNSELTLDERCLPILLKLSLRALSPPHPKLSSDQKATIASTFLSTLESFSAQPPPQVQTPEMIINLSTLHLRKVSALLQVFHETPSPTSDVLTATLTGTATTTLSFLEFSEPCVQRLAWDTLTWIMKIDFDIVLGMMDHLEPQLHIATVDFLQEVILTNFNLRTGVQFIKRWTELLIEAGEKESALAHPAVISSYQPAPLNGILIVEYPSKSGRIWHLLKSKTFSNSSLRTSTINEP